MTERDRQNEAEERVVLEGESREFSFATFAHYGSNDRSEEGKSLRAVVDAAGTVHGVPTYAEAWQEVCPGVEITTTSTESHAGGGRGTHTKTTYVRVHRAACPVVLRALHLSIYSSDHHQEQSAESITIRVVRAGD